MPLTASRESLLRSIQDGWTPKFVFFWSPTRHGRELGRECLSQWYPSSFAVDGLSYVTAEHWMMAEKARLFDDPEAPRERRRRNTTSRS